MDFRTLINRRKSIGRLGALAICLALLLALDGMVAGGRKDPHLHDLLPGQSLNLTDPLPRGAERLEDLSLRASSPNISVRLVETFSGFWLGGVLWRAEAAVPTDAAPGRYTVAMYYAHNGTEAAPPQRYVLRVHPDARAMQGHALSLVQRTLGVSPYFLAVCLLPLALLSMLLSLVISRNITVALAQNGLSEIFRALASPEGQRISFARPSEAPLPEGARVEVLDERAERSLGWALVVANPRRDAEALMQDGATVRPGTLARIT
ncbi:hypothetical protein SAMN04488503_2349 [Humidesulfovibrio mexicanus]|uniref:Uncharacterized protein n=1 Tax=Humidesulfovibrio mexicanus TaxID=147047 RepID=A0A239B0Q8_9BACT|nr:hypothetical protein [Humidesulfovibrio mexicanus]SNS01390.1 hypothetical protein SAMN04488503_2349 [Humidesulfovibrio mexicanus]